MRMNPKVDAFLRNAKNWQEELAKLSLKAAFDALTPGRQRAYILYFSAPKQSKTQQSRVEKCTQHILNGKRLNDQ